LYILDIAYLEFIESVRNRWMRSYFEASRKAVKPTYSQKRSNLLKTMTRKQINQIAVVVLFVMLFLWASACKPAESVRNGANGSPSKGLKLAFVTNNASDFWTIARKGVEKADAELDNVTVDFRLPGEGTAAEQKRIIDDLISSGINGIAISPVDPDNQTQLINDTAKKALVITQDSDAPKSDRAVYIGTDNVAAGRQAGELIKKHCLAEARSWSLSARVMPEMPSSAFKALKKRCREAR
jgi:ABC-type sugar transport system substrate-binding protein